MRFWDKVRGKVCFKCGRDFKDFTDKYRCKYCRKYFCSDHILPEKHNCRGHPKSPPYTYRVIETKEGKRKIISK